MHLPLIMSCKQIFCSVVWMIHFSFGVRLYHLFASLFFKYQLYTIINQYNMHISQNIHKMSHIYCALMYRMHLAVHTI